MSFLKKAYLIVKATNSRVGNSLVGCYKKQFLNHKDLMLILTYIAYRANAKKTRYIKQLFTIWKREENAR